MRRLVVLSLLLVLGGLALLFPTSSLYNLLTTGSASGGEAALQQAISPDKATTTESVVGFGMIGVGAILEFFSLFTEVGASTPTAPRSRSGATIRGAPTIDSKGDEPQ